jgi:outer membrane biosynthesis protein TonB
VAAATPSKSTGLAPYFRRYELPWSPSEEMERRFRAILRNLAIFATLLAIVIALLPKHEQVTNTNSLPPRVVKLMEPPPPPPPPPPKPEPKPLEKTPAPIAKAEPKPVDPHAKAAKMAAQFDDLAALRDVDLDKLAKNQKQTTDPGDVNTVTRALITASGGTSGGIAPSRLSSGLAAGSGSLNGIRTTQVQDPKLAAARGSAQAGGSGKASRSTEEIALVFTKNKGAIDMMYMRALRENPSLQGKIVVELTIAPSGDVTGVRIVSDDLNDPEFEAKLKARIASFKFGAKDVAQMIATRTIDFFPAG